MKYSLHINKGIWHVSFYIKDVNGKRKQKCLSTGFKALNGKKEINKRNANEKAQLIIKEYTEKHIDYKKRFAHTEYNINSNLDAISHAVCAMAIDVNAKCIVVNSVSGKTARMVSRFRCSCDILGTTTDEKAWRQLNLSWGVTPYLSEEYSSLDVMFYQAMHQAEKTFNLEPGDNVVLTGGRINGSSGNTDTIKVETVK